ncbi:AAA family ATPase [Pseudonocardia sp. RS010]|uniref:AAA family ATPase n=1 Tax=Pseudonocardia sp. RS010 TaxID=3385979 RepID=UPI0039A09A53
MMDFTAPEPEKPEEPPVPRLRRTRASQVRVRRQRWVWAHRIILGGLTLLAGREGLGKSTIACYLVAQVTRGTLEGEFYGTPRSVIYLHSEDARDATIVPRLRAAGADLDRVIFLDAIIPMDDGTDLESQVVFPSNVAEVAEAVTEEDAALVVLDAATSLIDSKLDGDKDRQMRQGLEKIARGIAEKAQCGVLGLVHFGKRDSGDTGKLILGSIAWSQVARSVLAVAKDEDDGTIVLSATKANLAPGDTASLRVRLVDTEVYIEEDDEVTHVGKAEIIGETDTDARDLLNAAPASPDEQTEIGEATAWLEDYLIQEGRTLSTECKAAARKAGLAERTLQRARKALDVRISSEGFPRRSYWSLPEPASDASGADQSPRARDGGTTGTTGPDLRFCNGADGTTAPVVPVVPTPAHGTTAGTTDPATDSEVSA